ncbi:MAG: type IV-A pilus assembly ATPase PilB [Candidatus Zixiibacteriota bacterium]
MALRLGEMLVNSGRLTEEQLEKALSLQEAEGGKLGEVLLKLGYIASEDTINEFLAKQLNIGTLKIEDIELNPEVVQLIPKDIARKFNVVATLRVGKSLFVATAEPKDVFVLDTLKFVTGLDVQPVLAKEESIRTAIENYYESDYESLSDIMIDIEDELEIIEEEEDDFDMNDLQQAVQEKPLVKLVNGILMEAISRGSSDIHIETYEKTTRVRYRIDGALIEAAPLPFKLRAAVVSRIKIMSRLDISERRLPQDGRIKIQYSGRPIDFRVSILPCVFGEKVVMRILDPESLMLDMTKLGFPSDGLEKFRHAISLPFGMVLVTGPTGSGKTTSLYSALSSLNQPDVNIMTAEDPVEYNLTGINQVQMHSEIGLTFAAALRSFLRQDPDIILVGEIRDKETADIAIKAALTGHLVFATLHTNDAPSTITRVIDMGVPPFMVATSVKLIMAQRLIRRVCEACKKPSEIEEEYRKYLRISKEEADEMTVYEGKGCDVCNGTGYKGRQGLYEIMPISHVIEKLIMEGASALEIAEQALKEGMRTLRQEAIMVMQKGKTTLEQVLSQTAD